MHFDLLLVLIEPRLLCTLINNCVTSNELYQDNVNLRLRLGRGSARRDGGGGRRQKDGGDVEQKGASALEPAKETGRRLVGTQGPPEGHTAVG